MLYNAAIAASALLLLAACGAGSATGPTAPTEGPPTDPLLQMMISFDGNHSRTEIKAAMDRAMTATNTPITEDNYSRGGSVLVTFRQKHGIEEMEILKCMPHRSRDARIAEHGMEIGFATVAAVCLTDLVEGNYP